MYLALVTVSALVCVTVGIFFGYRYRNLQDEVKQIKERLDEQDKLADAPTLIEVTPAVEREKKRYNPDPDSAIVIAKSPAEIARDKDRKLNEELDKLSR